MLWLISAQGRALLTGAAIGVALAASCVGPGGPSPRDIGVVAPRNVAASESNCPYPNDLPLGAIEPARPAWCSELVDGLPTFVNGPNGWFDDWEHGLNMATLGDGYREFAYGSLYRTATFRHNNHWMQDVAGQAPGGVKPPWNIGAISMRPDRAFRAENGLLIIEADVAAGVAGLQGVAWPEITVTTAEQPTGDRANAIYHYDRFQGHWTIGIRLEPSRVPALAMHPPNGPRRTELSHFDFAGTQRFGGGPYSPELDAAWRVCKDTDPDLDCRDRFRWEISHKRLTLWVNGVKYMEHTNLADNVDVPMELLTQPVYVYFAASTYYPSATTVRFHWDRLVINPATGPSSAIDTTSPSPGHVH